MNTKKGFIASSLGLSCAFLLLKPIKVFPDRGPASFAPIFKAHFHDIMEWRGFVPTSVYVPDGVCSGRFDFVGTGCLLESLFSNHGA